MNSIYITLVGSMNSEAFDLLEDYLEEKSDVFASIENSEVMFKKFPIISHN